MYGTKSHINIIPCTRTDLVKVITLSGLTYPDYVFRTLVDFAISTY